MPIQSSGDEHDSEFDGTAAVFWVKMILESYCLTLYSNKIASYSPIFHSNKTESYWLTLYSHKLGNILVDLVHICWPALSQFGN